MEIVDSHTNGAREIICVGSTSVEFFTRSWYHHGEEG